MKLSLHFLTMQRGHRKSLSECFVISFICVGEPGLNMFGMLVYFSCIFKEVFSTEEDIVSQIPLQ